MIKEMIGEDVERNKRMRKENTDGHDCITFHEREELITLLV